MLNTGLRTCEALGLLNSDIDLDRRVIHLQRGVKEIAKRNGTDAAGGMEMKVGKLKTASSKRDVPLNQAAVNAILGLRAERYFGENSPLIADERGSYTKPVNFRKRYYRILEAAGIEQKGLHSLRHTFATNLVNGVKQPDGSIKALAPRQVADLLGHSLRRSPNSITSNGTPPVWPGSRRGSSCEPAKIPPPKTVKSFGRPKIETHDQIKTTG